MKYYTKVKSPAGLLTLASDGENLSGLWIDGQKYYAAGLSPDAAEAILPVFDTTEKWLEIYFSGRAPDFTPPLLLSGSDYRKSVWAALLKIPYGKTMTYGGLSALISGGEGKNCARAAGGAAGHNPVSIIVPCHRVVGANGSLTGYAGGTDIKRRLLALERGEGLYSQLT